MPTSNFSQSDYLILIIANNSHTKCQTVQIKVSWLLKKPTDLDLHYSQAGYIRVQQDKGKLRHTSSCSSVITDNDKS